MVRGIFSVDDLRRVGRLRRKKTLGAKETGAHAALPIWMNFMTDAMSGKDPGQFQPPPEMTGGGAPKVDTPDTVPGADETH
jgi:membrane carboxypeptidase/penicillin-binding protein